MPIRVYKVADIVDRAVVFCGTWKSCNGDAAAIINCQPAADPIPQSAWNRCAANSDRPLACFKQIIFWNHADFYTSR
jgi:hypothetical protein